MGAKTKSQCLALALLCAGLVPARAQVPFTPPGITPDYVLTQVERVGSGRDRATSIISHHGDWTRIDTTKGALRTTEYHFAGDAITIFGPESYLTIRLGGEQASYIDYGPRNTGERQDALGESCTIWNVWRMRKQAPKLNDINHLSCVTDDGIELWAKSVSGDHSYSFYEATELKRRPVTPLEVEPPRSLVALDWWDSERASPGALPDHEVTLRFDNFDGMHKREVRYHMGWQLVDETLNGVRRSLEVSHSAASLSLRFNADEQGAPRRLTIFRFSLSPTDAPPLRSSKEPEDLGRSEIVLGERCHWFDMMPGMMDLWITACRTEDGITLKEHHRSRGAFQSWSAVRVARRPLTLRDVTPPKMLLDPPTWGIP
jgi:hypothetical protein